MKAFDTGFLKLLEAKSQFSVPIYQRKYSWTTKQCEELWNDVLRVGFNTELSTHFIGSIVYISDTLAPPTQISELLVIDGQQRLTTLSLLLLALSQRIKEIPGDYLTTSKRLVNYYLINNEEENEFYYKIKLTNRDHQTYENLIDEMDLPKDYSLRVKENFDFFMMKLSEPNIDLNDVYTGITKLKIVEIILDQNQDNPQLIFESLNSTGLDLSQSDLIRNYMLMQFDRDKQANMYKKYWEPMEQRFLNGNNTTLFDRFMRDYLTIKLNGRIPTMRDVYTEFKGYVVSDSRQALEEAIGDIATYSKWFIKLSHQADEDEEINDVLKDIHSLQVEVSYPFLMEVYRDYEKELITKNEFIGILRLVDSYVFRRSVTGIPTNSMNKTFANLSKAIDHAGYLESIQVAFILLDTYKRMPTDEEFSKELQMKDVYHFRNRNYLLRKLTNKDTKEIINIEKYTIEHIMPQNPILSIEWQNMLGKNWADVQKELLHTVGNLTITRYNSELSDRPFQEKRDMKGGFNKSPVRINASLRQLDRWNEDEIKVRGLELSQEALDIWTYPDVSEEIINSYREEDDQQTDEYTLEHFHLLTGKSKVWFDSLSKHILAMDQLITQDIRKNYISLKQIIFSYD